MSFSQDNGYQPTTFETLMDTLRQAINTEFSTNYTEGSFVGTNWYKYFYGPLQKVSENETKTAEVFLKLQEYIRATNLRIQRPSVSLPGLVDSFQARGYTVSVKKNLEADAGTMSVCVLVDDAAPNYPTKRLEICNLLMEFVGAGTVFIGTEEEEITISNGQQFTWKFSLPTKTPVLLRLTLTSSDNQITTIPNDEQIRIQLYANIMGSADVEARYRLGWDFEPQRYYTAQDAPWAATIKLEWSDDDGATWNDEVFEATFEDLFTFGLEDLEVLVDP